jgi:hypothetical protein
MSSLINKIVHEYVKELTDHPELLDFLNYTDVIPTDDTTAAQPNKKNKRKAVFEEYKSADEIRKGIITGKYHQGKILVNRNNLNEARVETSSQSVLIKGKF